MNKIDKQRQKMEVTRKEFMAAIKMDELEYNTLVFEGGMAFLEKTFKKNTEAIRFHSRERMYWAWYRLTFFSFEENYLARKTSLNGVRNLPPSLVVQLFLRDYRLFMISSKFILVSFQNYITVSQKKEYAPSNRSTRALSRRSFARHSNSRVSAA